MCDFVSWIEYEGHSYFLTNADLKTKEGKKLLAPNVADDICGHGAIRAYYPELKNRGSNKECVDFSSPKNFPADIAKAIKQGEMFCFGRPLELLMSKGKKAYQDVEAQAFAAAFKKYKVAAWK